MICVGGPLDGQDRKVRPGDPSFVARATWKGELQLVRYHVQMITVGEQMVAFVAYIEGMDPAELLKECQAKYLQQLVDTAIPAC